MASVHIIGGGISGLAAATRLAEKHVPVKLYEATAHAGGRCRSSRDAALGVIDHGLHLTRSDDHELARYLTRISEGDARIATAALPIPAAPLLDWIPVFGQWLRPDRPLAARMAPASALGDAWWRPLARVFYGTLPDALPSRVLRRALHHRRPRVMPGPLQAGYIQPALDYLERCGGSVYFSHALTRIDREQGIPHQLVFARKRVALHPGDVVILATPPSFTQSMLPGLAVPAQLHSAITLHYAIASREPAGQVRYPLGAPMDLLRFEADRISAGLRIADASWHGDSELLAHRVWRAIQREVPYLRGEPMPAYAIWREKRAGHGVADAPPIPWEHGSLLLAGDWLDPAQPATLEAAAAHGHRAAERALRLLRDTRPHQQQFYLN